MRQPARRPALATLLALAAAASGCNALNPEDCHELSATIQPLEPAMLSTTYLPWPSYVTTQVEIRNGPNRGYYTCQARGYVLQPIDRVYAALKNPSTTYLHNDNGGTTRDVADVFDIAPESVASVSFRVHYKNATGLGFDVKYQLDTWIGWLQGAESNPLQLGFRTHKICGTTHIRTMDGSITVKPVAPADLPAGTAGASALEMVYWLDADTQDQGNCNGTLADQFGGITGWLNAH